MPRVPISDNVVPFDRGPSQPAPNPTMLAMAAAVMHEQGRLFDPTPLGPEQKFEKDPNQRVKEGFDAAAPEDWAYSTHYGADIYRTTTKGRTRRDVIT